MAINSNGTSPGPAAHLTGDMAMTVVGGIATAVAPAVRLVRAVAAESLG